MPANPKHLTRSKWQRFAKISAAIIGGYMVSTAFHLALATWLATPIVLITATFSVFILWAILMVLAFMVNNGWKIWGLYLVLTGCFVAVIYVGKVFHPGI